MKGILGFSPAPNLTGDLFESVVNHLFSTHKNMIFNCDTNDKFLDFILEEMLKVSFKTKKTTWLPDLVMWSFTN